jgi:FAD/FMN-containing dehydrogenase
MISAVRAAPKSGFLWVRLGCGDLHALKRCFILTISQSLYSQHPTFLTDEKNAAEMTRVELAMQEIFDFAISLGGTITGEHGVGLAKKPFLRRALGNASLDLMKLLKKSLDPIGILNPGKIFD